MKAQITVLEAGFVDSVYIVDVNVPFRINGNLKLEQLARDYGWLLQPVLTKEVYETPPDKVESGSANKGD